MLGKGGFEGRSVGGGFMGDDLVSGRIARRGKMCIFDWMLRFEIRVAVGVGSLRQVTREVECTE